MTITCEENQVIVMMVAVAISLAFLFVMDMKDDERK